MMRHASVTASRPPSRMGMNMSVEAIEAARLSLIGKMKMGVCA